MRSLRSNALPLAMLSLLAVGLTSCTHKQLPSPPPASTAPPLSPTTMTKEPPVPAMPAPAQPKVGPPGSDQQVQEAQPAPPRHPRRAKKHPVVADPASPAVQPANPPPVVAVATPAPAPEPSLGQLSAGAGADSHERAAMSEQIHEQELRLSKIKHPLNNEDQAIVKQVEAFLTKARQAVAESDLDGAQTLTTKAKVLLDELTRS